MDSFHMSYIITGTVEGCHDVCQGRENHRGTNSELVNLSSVKKAPSPTDFNCFSYHASICNQSGIAYDSILHLFAHKLYLSL